MTDQALGVAQRSPQERQNLDAGQYPDQGAQPGAGGGAAEDIARSGEEPDGRSRCGQTEQPGQRQSSVGRARFVQDATDGLHGRTADSGAVRTSMTASNVARSVGS